MFRDCNERVILRMNILRNGASTADFLSKSIFKRKCYRLARGGCVSKESWKVSNGGGGGGVRRSFSVIRFPA